MNRIQAAIPELAARIAALDADARTAFDGEMAITLHELYVFQNAQARAHAAGRISTEEASTIYAALGGDFGGSPSNGGWAKGVTTATKVAVTMAVSELLL